MSNEMREQLAAYAHEAWSAYMGHFLGKCITQPNGSLLIPSGYVQAIEQLIATPYSDLHKADKVGDLLEADKMITIMQARP